MSCRKFVHIHWNTVVHKMTHNWLDTLLYNLLYSYLYIHSYSCLSMRSCKVQYKFPDNTLVFPELSSLLLLLVLLKSLTSAMYTERLF